MHHRSRSPKVDAKNATVKAAAEKARNDTAEAVAAELRKVHKQEEARRRKVEEALRRKREEVGLKFQSAFPPNSPSFASHTHNLYVVRGFCAIFVGGAHKARGGG